MNAPLAEPRYQRSTGEAAVVLADAGGRPTTRTVRQAGSAKLRFPRNPHAVEAMLLNTSGGLASGDTFRTEMVAEAHTLTLSTLACERVYRCDGPPARLAQSVRVAAGARLNHLPQPTIVYDRAKLHRLTLVELEEGASLTLCEGLVLGRAAHGEAGRRATVRERIEVRLAGRLVFVDALGLDDAVLARADRLAGLAGARGIGIVIHVGAGDAETARAALQDAPVRWGASTIGPVTVVRCLAPDHTSLQDTLGRAASALSGAPLPRAWQL